ncbi:MAG: hypothetical protein M3R08_08990 [Bacteroidota bacterium]|nr:hypothetical protein [Bacteroidota bacterium]
MANKRLSEKDIDQLLNQYRGERRRLSFQLETVRKAIKDLKAVRPPASATNISDVPVIKRGPGRPRKSESGINPMPQIPGRRKKRQIKDGGYRLSDWDSMVIESISKTDKLLPKEEILKTALDWAKKSHPEMSDADVEAKITRVLQKLSGKRGALGTHRSGLRRGYHYGVKDWFFASSGKLRKQHLDKLILQEEAV